MKFSHAGLLTLYFIGQVKDMKGEEKGMFASVLNSMLSMFSMVKSLLSQELYPRNSFMPHRLHFAQG